MKRITQALALVTLLAGIVVIGAGARVAADELLAAPNAPDLVVDRVDEDADAPDPPAGMPGEPGRMARHEAMARELHLSDTQRQKLEVIHDRQRRKAIEVRAQIQLATLDLDKLARVEEPSERAIDAKIDEVANLRASLRKSQVAALFEARAVLTPEQRKLFREHFGFAGGFGRDGHEGGEGRGRGLCRLPIGRGGAPGHE